MSNAQHHDPVRFATSLSAKLATRSRHVCVFLGAGLGKTAGLPDVDELQDKIVADLDEQDRSIFVLQLRGRNLEAALSRLRRIAALLTGNETVDGLTATEAKRLDAAVCSRIVQLLGLEQADLSTAVLLAEWAAHTNYRAPLEFFTVNYDLLLETAFDRVRVPYFDGFLGTLEAGFHTELVEDFADHTAESMPAFLVRLWKLHGSVNWSWDNNRTIVRLGQPVSTGLAAAIYPSDAKYEESQRVPFVVLQDRLRRSLNQAETLLLITGYSFGDEHLNEQIFAAAKRRERSEFVAFCFSRIPDALAERAEVTPNLQVVSGNEAILGGIRAAWRETQDAPVDVWSKNEFRLSDLRNLARYLARSTAPEHLTGIVADAVTKVDRNPLDEHDD